MLSTVLFSATVVVLAATVAAAELHPAPPKLRASKEEGPCNAPWCAPTGKPICDAPWCGGQAASDKGSVVAEVKVDRVCNAPWCAPTGRPICNAPWCAPFLGVAQRVHSFFYKKE